MPHGTFHSKYQTRIVAALLGVALSTAFCHTAPAIEMTQRSADLAGHFAHWAITNPDNPLSGPAYYLVTLPPMYRPNSWDLYLTNGAVTKNLTSNIAGGKASIWQRALDGIIYANSTVSATGTQSNLYYSDGVRNQLITDSPTVGHFRIRHNEDGLLVYGIDESPRICCQSDQLFAYDGSTLVRMTQSNLPARSDILDRNGIAASRNQILFYEYELGTDKSASQTGEFFVYAEGQVTQLTSVAQNQINTDIWYTGSTYFWNLSTKAANEQRKQDVYRLEKGEWNNLTNNAPGTRSEAVGSYGNRTIVKTQKRYNDANLADAQTDLFEVQPDGSISPITNLPLGQHADLVSFDDTGVLYKVGQYSSDGTYLSTALMHYDGDSTQQLISHRAGYAIGVSSENADFQRVSIKLNSQNPISPFTLAAWDGTDLQPITEPGVSANHIRENTGPNSFIYEKHDESFEREDLIFYDYDRSLSINLTEDLPSSTFYRFEGMWGDDQFVVGTSSALHHLSEGNAQMVAKDDEQGEVQIEAVVDNGFVYSRQQLIPQRESPSLPVQGDLFFHDGVTGKQITQSSDTQLAKFFDAISTQDGPAIFWEFTEREIGSEKSDLYTLMAGEIIQLTNNPIGVFSSYYEVGSDYAFWETRYPDRQVLYSANLSTIPEPSTILLVAVALMLVMQKKRSYVAF